MLGRKKDTISGEALVASVEDVLPTANPVTFRGKLVVWADGVPKTTVDHKERYWRRGGVSVIEIWPTAGETVPVTVDRADPTRVHIEWDQIIEAKKSKRADAKRVAEQRLIRDAYDRGRPE
jgi:hypothetical protein